MIVHGQEFREDRAARYARHAIEVAANRDSARPAYELFDTLRHGYDRDVPGSHPADREAFMRTARKVCGL